MNWITIERRGKEKATSSGSNEKVKKQLNKAQKVDVVTHLHFIVLHYIVHEIIEPIDYIAQILDISVST